MTAPSTDDRLRRSWRENRPYLVDLAFRMLGDVGEAEDVVQEAFTRLADTAADQIDSERGWLTVVTSRICLDQLRSARARRERTDETAIDVAATPLTGQPAVDPVDRVTLDDEVRNALDLVLRRLSPAERVAFILHDVFATPFDAIADTLGKPVGTCRQLARRARHKITAASPRPGTLVPPEHRAVTEAFINACSTGDVDALVGLLHPNVWGVAEFDGQPPAARRVSHGVDTVAPILHRFLKPPTTLVSLPVAHEVRLLAYCGTTPYATIELTVDHGRVRRIHVRLSPGSWR
jgi:RNA polymerase sigma-70 factor (ECF subfamily)